MTMPSPLRSTGPSGFASGKKLPTTAVLKLALVFLLPAILILAVLAYTMLRTDVNVRLHKLQTQETGAVRFAEQMLIHDFDSAISDLKLLAQAPSLRRYVNENSPDEKQRLTEQFKIFAQTKLRYDKIRYLDIGGMEKIRVDLLRQQAVVPREKDLQNEADQYFFREILKLAAGEIYVSPLDLNIEHGKVEIPYKPVIRFGIPVFNRAGRKQGILLINFHGQTLLDDFTHAMQEPQHAMLLNSDGYWLSNPDSRLEWAHMLGRDDTFGKYHPAAWAKISSMQQGSLLMPEGLYTVATVHPLVLKAHEQQPDNHQIAPHSHDGYFWKIVSLIPADEVPAVSFSQYPRSFTLFAIGLVLLVFLSLFIATSLHSRRRFHAAIFESEAHLKEITSTLGEGILVVDQQELATYINPEAERLLGWTQAELTGKNVHDMIHHHTQDGTAIHAVDCDVYQVLKTGKSIRSNTQVFWRKDGSFMHVNVSASPIVRDDRIMGAVVAFSDISRQKQDEAALLHSEAQLKQAQRLTQIGSWELNFATTELTWSDEIYRIFEIDPATFGASYEAFLSLIHPQDRERVNLAFNESVQQHVPYSTEHRVQLADGRIKHVLERGEAIYDDNDRPARAIGTVQDITARKQTEDALRSSKETARALLNATTESATLIDASGTVLAINKTGAKRFNKRADEIIAHNIYELFPARIAAIRKNLVEKVVLSGEPGQFQDEHDGIHLAHSLYPVFDAQDRVSQIAIYSTDITENLKLQSEETLLQHIDQQLLRNTPLPGLLQFICDEIVQLFSYHFVWLGKKETGGELTLSAQSGNASAYLQELRRIGVRWDDTPQGRGPTGSCIRNGQIQVSRVSDSGFLPWHDAAGRFDFHSVAGIPLVVRGEVYGALTLYSRLEHDFDDSVTLKRLSNIASRICVALEMAMDQEQLRLLSTALASAGNGVFITDASGKILWVNNSFSRLTGYSNDEAVGQFPSLLKSGKQDATYYKILWQTIKQGNTWNNETVERHKNGDLFTVQQTITPIKNEEGVVSHFVSILDDITAQKETAAHIQHMAHFDALTDLPNRALFHDRLHQMLAQAKREGKTCALMFLDLDRFKMVNDTLGHHIGDLLLQGVAERLTACVRETDTVSRLAGDEFTVLLPNVRGREDAALIAVKITASLAAPFILDGHKVNIGSSTGIAFYPADADSDEGLLKCADQAMYAAKNHGRGTFSFYRAP